MRSRPIEGMETFIDRVKEDKFKLQNSISNWLNRVDLNYVGDQPEAGWEGIDEDEEEDGGGGAVGLNDQVDRSVPGWVICDGMEEVDEDDEEGRG